MIEFKYLHIGKIMLELKYLNIGKILFQRILRILRKADIGPVITLKVYKVNQ